MKQILLIVLMISVPMVFGLVAVLLLFRLARKNEPKPCYRCGVTATAEYMSIPYCMMCRIVVIRMLPAVRHDPPYGFPGSPGYTDFSEVPSPNQFGKKEN